MKPISLTRFNVIAGYARHPDAHAFGNELAWFESEDGAFTGAIIVDTDGQYSGLVLGRDLAGRFRWIGQTGYYSASVLALGALAIRILGESLSGTGPREQGDEGAQVDFFHQIVETERMHPSFEMLMSDSAWTPAKHVISELMRWYEDQDGNFIEQFQSTGFDARVWELYVFALLVEAGHIVSSPHPAPDFLATSGGTSFALEATTVNPSIIGGAPAPSEKPTDPAGTAAYFQHYLPIRYAGPLTKKLAKRYWESAGVSGLPLVFAIQDFHDQFSMTFSGQGLQTYLYGRVIEVVNGESNASPIVEHHWGSKTIDSGFFYLPEAEHVSAVIFNGSGTLSKFNRLGVSAGFESPARLLHRGLRLSPEGTPRPFVEEVTSEYNERWVDGSNVFHNPRALIPLPETTLPGAAHHYWDGARFLARYPAGHIDSSMTVVIKPVAP